MSDDRPAVSEPAHDDQANRPEQNEQPVDQRGANRSQRPASKAFRVFVAGGWAPRPTGMPERSPAAAPAASRRRRIGERFSADHLVVPAGPLVARSNDTDYRFRPHSAFAHLTGLGTEREPDAVLVLHPARPRTGTESHEAVLYFRPRAERDTEEFYADARYGELWVGVRPALEELAAETGLRCAHVDDLEAALTAGTPSGTAPSVRVVSGADPAVDAMVARLRGEPPGAQAREDDAELVEALAELRLVKDPYEVDQLRLAVRVTVAGFEDIVRALPEAVAHPRGERVVETAFGSRARRDGNAVGYETIAAAGDHACTLHWIRNDGAVRPGELVLVDAGVEVDSLYTADVTRTLPVDGAFTPPQRQLYDAVLDAADAAFAVVRPGATLRDVHTAAMGVIAARLESWGWLPTGAEESLAPEGQFHRRWMVHGTSHHLGLDVHDCAQARREVYLDGALEPGMVFTIEPGLYVKADDLTVPPEYRGIGIRIEDDVLVTPDGVENLSAALPRSATDVEAWMADLARGRTGRWRP